MKTKQALLAVLLLASSSYIVPLHADERKTAPTWLYRNASIAAQQPSDITTATCHYKPLFGKADGDASVMGSVARFGEAVIDPHGSCAAVQYPGEDQIFLVLEGIGSAKYADQNVPLGKEDFLYVPATVSHTLTNTSSKPMTVVVMGFSTKGFPPSSLPAHPLKSNIEDVPLGFVGGHPQSTHYRLLLGNVPQTRDKIDVGNVVTSLFLMEIDPGGTNFPHHHPNAEEIYLILDGHGTEVAGGGADGVEGLHPAKAGDAYFYRLNATVGYYSAPGVHSRILCVRSFDPSVARHNN